MPACGREMRDDVKTKKMWQVDRRRLERRVIMFSTLVITLVT
jgi:hypothetical protein